MIIVFSLGCAALLWIAPRAGVLWAGVLLLAGMVLGTVALSAAGALISRRREEATMKNPEDVQDN